MRRLTTRKTRVGQVSSFPLQNLICLRIQLQIDSITPYTTTVYCTAHIQIVSIGLFTKQFYVQVFHFSAMSLSFNKHVTKKFFKLTNLVQIWLKLNKKRLQTSTDSSVVDCTACPLFFGRCGGGGTWRVQFQHRAQTFSPQKFVLCLENCAEIHPEFGYFWQLTSAVWRNVHDKTKQTRPTGSPETNSSLWETRARFHTD